MVDYKKKYHGIVNGLVRESFPELRKKGIVIVEMPKMVRTWSFAQRGIKNNYIFINKSRRGASIGSLKGQFAHELCHLILDHIDKSLFGDIFHNWFKKFPSFFFNTTFSRKIESKIDKEVINRGYAMELIKEHEEWIEVFGEEFIKSNLYARGYLSISQIKSYAKRVKKW